VSGFLIAHQYSIGRLFSDCQGQVQGPDYQDQGLLIKDKTKVNDIQCKAESLCKCSANLCTVHQRVRLTDTTTVNAILYIKTWCKQKTDYTDKQFQSV